MIVKVQTPIASNAVAPEAFVYNKDRSVEFFMPIFPELVTAMAGSPKKYFEVHFIKDRLSDQEDAELMVIDNEVEDQDW